jgi:uncharacterized membrane protein
VGNDAIEGGPRKLAWFGRPTFGGAVVGLLFWWRSLYPTLMPRTWLAQALVTALSVALGYAIGTLAGHVGHRLLQRWDREPPASSKRWAWWAVALGGLVVLVLSIVVWPNWQDDQRDLLGMEGISRWGAIPMVLVATLVLGLLVLLGRLIGRGVIRLHRFNGRHLPHALAAPVTVVLVIVIGVFVLRDVAGAWLVGRANDAFGTVDTSTNEGTEQPTSAFVSGSPDSLVEWDSLGVQGRDFVAQATPLERMEEFHGTADDDGGRRALEPIRVYTGIRSEEELEARAELAVAELRRTEAFDREVLVVATTTGTGWIDPDAAEALEVLHRGDTAIVGMQYSYLPSWISSLVDKGAAQAAGAALYDAVYDAWVELPEGERPRLIAFGLSLGSYGGEAAFSGVDAGSSVANLAARTDGALFVGPTNDNTIWRQLTEGRDEGSPWWQPVFEGGDQVRFRTRGPDATELPEAWDGPRILYVQHPSDPVTFWSMDTLWREPGWMERPTGHDVPDRVRWTPVVTWVQGLYDLTAGFAAPPGHGHDYRLDYADAWATVVAPEGWTDDDTERLESFLFPEAE